MVRSREYWEAKMITGYKMTQEDWVDFRDSLYMQGDMIGSNEGSTYFYATFLIATELDSNGDAIPAAAAQYEGRQYVIKDDGYYDFGAGSQYWKEGDIIQCLYDTVAEQYFWVQYGNIFPYTPPEATIGQVLVYDGSGWSATYNSINYDGQIKANWENEFRVFADNGDLLLDGTDDGLYLYSNVGGTNRLSILVRERTLKTQGNISRARWQDNFEVYDNADQPVLVAGNSGVKIAKNLAFGTYHNTTDDSFTIPNNVSVVRSNKGAPIASGTITFPATPVDGQLLSIYGYYTSVTLDGNGATIKGASITSMNGNTAIRYSYNAPDTSWYPF